MDVQEWRKKLLKAARKELEKLDSAGGAALSMEAPLSDEQERAVAALSGYGNARRGGYG